VLLSMTGFGEARRHDQKLQVSVEVRSVNNRHLKVTVRCPEAALGIENEIERIVRGSIGRGTVNVNLRITRVDGVTSSQLDLERLRSYWQELSKIAAELKAEPPKDLTRFIDLPGVINDSSDPLVSTDQWPIVEAAVREALGKLDEFRQREGVAMRDEMAGLCKEVQGRVHVVAERAPEVVTEYRAKIKQRVSDLLRESEVVIGDADLIREVSIFADRCDITEELARLRSHVDQFLKLLDATPSSGRQLEFLCQEFIRELNTIGSKANDITIAHAIVEGKAAVEKMREIVQNVE
jgi:uncharacterized protein (TIGR00255 family)